MKMSGFLMFVLALGTLILLLVNMSNFNVVVFASSYYILFCYGWLLSIRSLLFSDERQKGSGSGGDEKCIFFI